MCDFKNKIVESPSLEFPRADPVMHKAQCGSEEQKPILGTVHSGGIVAAQQVDLGGDLLTFVSSVPRKSAQRATRSSWQSVVEATLVVDHCDPICVLVFP